MSHLPYADYPFLWIHFGHLVHCIELHPTPLHMAILNWTLPHSCSPPTTILVLLILTFMPFLAKPSFHWFNFWINSVSLSGISTKSSAYSSSKGNSTADHKDGDMKSWVCLGNNCTVLWALWEGAQSWWKVKICPKLVLFMIMSLRHKVLTGKIT